jgi:hypothetical protein
MASDDPNEERCANQGRNNTDIEFSRPSDDAPHDVCCQEQTGPAYGAEGQEPAVIDADQQPAKMRNDQTYEANGPADSRCCAA